MRLILFVKLFLLSCLLVTELNANIPVIYNAGLKSYQANNYQRAYYLWLKLAQDGHDMSQNNIGQLYLDGNGVTKDTTKAIYWFKKASDQGNSDAKTSLGRIYYYQNDKQKAIKLWTEAAQAGNKIAEKNLVNAGVNFAIDASKKLLSKVLFGGGAGGGFSLPGFGGGGGSSTGSKTAPSKSSSSESTRCKYITDPNIRGLCRAFTKNNQSYCRDISNSNWRNYCRAKFYNSTSYCRNITDPDIQSFCYGRCKQIRIASSRRNQDLQNMCWEKSCYHIKDSNYKQLCKALNNE